MTLARRHLLLAGPAMLGTAFAQDRPLVLGILNQQSATATAQRWNPILRYLTDMTGIALQWRMGATVQETNAMMGRGEFDLVFSNHNFRPEFDGTYRVLAKWSDKPIFGVVAVLADSKIRHLRELAGQRVVFPSRNAFVAYAVPMAEFRRLDIAVQPVMAAHQDGALSQLKAQAAQAAAVNSRFLTQYAAQNGLAYREIYTSQPFPDLPLSVHPRVPERQVEALRDALLAMRASAKAREAVTGANFEGFVPATEKEYNGTRKVYRTLGDA